MKLLPKGWRAWRRVLLVWVGIFFVAAALVVYGCSCMSRMPGTSYSGTFQPLDEQECELQTRLEQHVRRLAEDIGERNMHEDRALRAAALYIAEEFTTAGYEVAWQEYEVGGQTVKNIEVELAGASHSQETVVVGGHYDSVLGSPGANDNATGVAAVLEIARLLRDTGPARTVRFVAFVNEEPPYFQTDEMGSLVFARRSRERGENIVAMISLETIGYYSEEPDSQAYPPPFNLLYPDQGNFIAFVGNVASRKLVRRCVKSFRQHTSFPSEGGAIPSWITGIGWSDHWSFWETGYPALMVTDTAPFRYQHYHTMQDTVDKVDYEHMARVTAGVSRVVADLANEGTK